MFHQSTLVRLCSALALSLAASIAMAQTADGCACMCVEGSPFNVCTGFVSSQEQTAECDLLECPAVADEPAPEPDPVPVDEPVATIDPPHPGLECERRSVYRPDLGRYKKYKVCRPTADNRHRRRHERHARRNSEEWAARHERRKARWEARMARHRERHARHHDDHDKDDS